MIILLGPFGPKSMAEALEASENVGDGTVTLVITDNVVVMDVNHVEVMLIVI